eukprot:scaffold22890_cov109-Skeletonema_dohrnii-CCMP3373.AAC.3
MKVEMYYNGSVGSSKCCDWMDRPGTSCLCPVLYRSLRFHHFSHFFTVLELNELKPIIYPMSDTGNNSSQSAGSMLSDELLDLCKSDSLSEEGLREIFELHQNQLKLAPNNDNQHVSDYDFFFAACCNERVTERIIKYLLEYFPAAASAADDKGQLPLHVACGYNKNVTVNIIQLLIDAAPDSVRSVNKCTFKHPYSLHSNRVINEGWMPLHYLCDNENVGEISALEILKLLVEKYPEAVRHADNKGLLPLHFSCEFKTPEFCRVLIEAYPGSERMSNNNFGVLPFHCACGSNSVATVEYLYKLYPDAINHAATNGLYSIHDVIICMTHRTNQTAAVETVRYLLKCDPNVIFQKFNGIESMLHFACHWGEYNESNIGDALEFIKVMYDANPEAIEDDEMVSDIHEFHQQVQAFINRQLVYASQAEDHRQMMTPDMNGQLPLHRALQNNVRLGSIKLLVKGNPSAIRNVDISCAMPLHVACEYHDSPTVVQYLVELDTTTLGTVDSQGNTVLHLACRGAKYETIALILDKYDAVSVSKRNAHKKLPLDLLWESNEVQDRESIEYTESVFRLLKAFPELLMNTGKPMQSSASAACPGQTVKKRKLGHE